MRIVYLRVKKDQIKHFDIGNEELLTMALTYGTAALALEPSAAIAQTQVDRDLDPIISTIRSLGKPICYGSLYWGWLQVMLGQKTEGYKRLKGSAWGYLGLMFVPKILNVLDKAGRGLNG